MNELEILTFQCAKHHFALPTGQVGRIVLIPALIPLPQAPPLVAGLVNVAGQFIPVISLRKKFGMPEKAVELEDYLIITKNTDRPLALWVDAVGDVATIDTAAASLPQSGETVDSAISGVLELQDKTLFIYDLERCLNNGEAVALDAALDQWRTDKDG